MQAIQLVDVTARCSGRVFAVRKYTAVVEDVDLNRLKTCAASAEVGYPGLAELYFTITGDAAGRVVQFTTASYELSSVKLSKLSEVE